MNAELIKPNSQRAPQALGTLSAKLPHVPVQQQQTPGAGGPLQMIYEDLPITIATVYKTNV